MRLSPKEISLIIKALAPHFAGIKVSLYLYGSRTNDKLKGGDIDLLAQFSEDKKCQELNLKKHILLADIKNEIGEQKIDLSLKTKDQVKEDPYWSQVLTSAVFLKSFS